MNFMARNLYLHSTVSSSVSWSCRAIFPSASPCGRAFYSQRGFSLLELLLVLFILGLMATSAVLMTQGVEDQSKYDETKRRMEMIKRAIIGDPTRTVNGGPEISGFVADMGRLPNSLEELIDGTGLPPFSTSTSAVQEVTVNLQGGWRGPYIEILPDTGGNRVLRDGYGNDFISASGVAEWRVKSVGPDIVNAADDYPVSAVIGAHDANVLVSTFDFEVGISGVGATVNFGKAPTTNPSEPLVLRIYFWTEAGLDEIEGDLPVVSGVAAVSGVAQHPVTFDSGEILPIGRYAAVVLCAVTGEVYDGDCTSNEIHRAPAYFLVAPRSQLPTIRWDIQ